jgi:hypothetical protein
MRNRLAFALRVTGDAGVTEARRERKRDAGLSSSCGVSKVNAWSRMAVLPHLTRLREHAARLGLSVMRVDRSRLPGWPSVSFFTTGAPVPFLYGHRESGRVPRPRSADPVVQGGPSPVGLLWGCRTMSAPIVSDTRSMDLAMTSTPASTAICSRPQLKGPPCPASACMRRTPGARPEFSISICLPGGELAFTAMRTQVPRLRGFHCPQSS